MIIAMRVAKGRLAANVRPTFWQAWGWVALDMALVLGLLAVLFMPIVQIIAASQPSDQSTGFFLFVTYVVVPVGVLINACWWAARSRKRY